MVRKIVFMCYCLVWLMLQHVSGYSQGSWGRRGGDHVTGVRDTQRVAEWIRLRKDGIKTDITCHEYSRYHLSVPEVNENRNYERVTYRVADMSRIVFQDSSFLLFAVHSSHQDSKLGDIILVSDQHGKIYYHKEHVCGGLVHFYREGSQVPYGVNDFIKGFKGDISQLGWAHMP